MTVEVNESTFINMLWERVDNFRNPYPEDFWEQVFEFLSECGWLDPEHMNPSYIVDNIAINAEVITAEEAEEEGITEEDCIYIAQCEDDTYFIINLGL